MYHFEFLFTLLSIYLRVRTIVLSFLSKETAGNSKMYLKNRQVNEVLALPKNFLINYTTRVELNKKHRVMLKHPGNRRPKPGDPPQLIFLGPQYVSGQ